MWTKEECNILMMFVYPWVEEEFGVDFDFHILRTDVGDPSRVSFDPAAPGIPELST